MLTEAEPEEVPAFALVVGTGTALRVLAHGGLTVTVHGPAEQSFSAADALTWLERTIDAPYDRVTVVGEPAGAATAPGAVPFDLEAGTVPGSGVTLWAARQAQPPLLARVPGPAREPAPLSIPVPTAEPIPGADRSADPRAGRCRRSLRRLRRSPPARTRRSRRRPRRRPSRRGTPSCGRWRRSAACGWPAGRGQPGRAGRVGPRRPAVRRCRWGRRPRRARLRRPVRGRSSWSRAWCAGPGTSATRRRRSCRTCGAARESGAERVTQPRPPLGVLVTDDGSVFTLTGDYVLGRDPGRAPAVLSGAAAPLVLRDEEHSTSRVHARLTLSGWTVRVSDGGSANGTFVSRSGPAGPWTPVDTGTGTRLYPGDRVRVGHRQLLFDCYHEPLRP